jgi:putative addiction module component (TIGR02574 family)
MSALLDTVRAQSRNLPSDEKLLLGVELIDAVWLGKNDEESPESVAQAWDEEIQRRVEEVRSGQVKPVPWEEVLAQTNARFGWDK